MRKFFVALVYTAFGLGANPVMAESRLNALIIHSEPKELASVELLDGADEMVTFGATDGKWRIVNFWATWCAPCREEMPSLLALQKARPDWVVLPVATGRNPIDQINRFYAEAKVIELPILRDPQKILAAKAGVIGLPVTLVLNPEGQEVARLIGGLDWDAPETIAALDALTK